MRRRSPVGKWIEGLTPRMPVTDAARRVLDLRLEAVEIALPRASEDAGEDVEHVHRLRVATRRADAAVRAFDSFLDARRIRRVRKHLRAIRRAAGMAREYDVFGIMLRDLDRDVLAPWHEPVEAMLHWTHQARLAAQQSIVERASPARIAKLRTRHQRLLASIHEDAEHGPMTLEDLADVQLGARIAGVQEALKRDLRILTNLHAVRIQCKHLRYSIEIFSICFEGDSRATLEQMRSMQDRLGEINDVEGLLDLTQRFAEECEQGAGREATAGALAALAALRDRRVESFLEQLESGAWRGFPERLLETLTGRMTT